MRIIRNRFESYRDYRAYPYAYLFHKIGMYSAILETDPSGTFVGSSFCYATARDWARFGQLYLQDGVWEGERILPEGWVDYSVHRTTLSKNEKFGAHFWRLPAGQTETPGIPEDMFWAAGHDGQFVNIVPASELVIVRLGMNKHSEAWNQNEFVAKIIAAIGPR
jgi:CubicO group peptidase (beta-lactamase class C family)